MANSSPAIGCRLPLVVTPAGLDHWSAVRELHAYSFAKLIAPGLDPEQADAMLERFHAPDYTDTLLTHDLQTAWYEGTLVGTAGWVPADDQGHVARLTSLAVSPLFTRLGVGRALVHMIETRARTAGFASFSVRAFPAVAGFYEALGYTRSSQGVTSVGTGDGVPVMFMRKAGSSAATSGDDCGEPADTVPG